MFGTRVIFVIGLSTASLVGAAGWAAAGTLAGAAGPGAAGLGDGAIDRPSSGVTVNQVAETDPVSIAGAQPGTKGGPAMDKGGPTFSIMAKPYYGFQSRPATGIGFHEFGNLRIPMTFDNASNDVGVEVGLRVDFNRPLWGMGKKWGLDFNINHFGTHSDHTAEQIPAQGGNIGLFGPFAGGGVATAQDLNNIRLINDFARTEGEIRLGKEYTVARYGEEREMRMRSYLGLVFGGVEVDDNLDLRIGNNIDYRSRIKMDNFYVGPTGGFMVNVPMPMLDLPNSRYVFFFGGYGRVLFNDTDATRNVDLTGGANLSGSDELSHSETTLGGGFKVGGRYNFGSFSAHWGGEFAINNNLPKLDVNLDTGDAKVRYGDAREFRVSVGAKYTFGGGW